MRERRTARAAALGLALGLAPAVDAAPGGRPLLALTYPGYRLAGTLESIVEFSTRATAARLGRAHIVPRSQSDEVRFVAAIERGRWIHGSPDARATGALWVSDEPRTPEPRDSLGLRDRLKGADRLLYRIRPQAGASMVGWAFREGTGDMLGLPLPPGADVETSQVRLAQDGSGAAALYRARRLAQPGTPAIWLTPLCRDRSDLTDILERHAPGQGGRLHNWVQGVGPEALTLVEAAGGTAWLARADGRLLAVGAAGEVRYQLERPTEVTLESGYWAPVAEDHWTYFHRPPGVVVWRRGTTRGSYRPTQGSIHDLSVGVDTLVVVLARTFRNPLIEVVDLASGEVRLRWEMPAVGRVQLVGKHLLLAETEHDVELLQLWVQPSQVPTDLPPAPAATYPRRGPRHDRDGRPGPPVSLFVFLFGVAGLCYWMMPVRVTTGPGRSATPSRPAGSPEAPGAGPDAEPDPGGIEFLAGEDFPVQATELLATLLYLRAADELRGRGELDPGIFEELRRRARVRVMPLWDEIFPGAAPAVHAWLGARLASLEGHLDAAALASLREALAERAGGAAADAAPEGRLAQLYKLHLLYAAAAEVGGDLPALRAHVFDQALAVLRRLQAEREFPTDFAARVRAEVADTLGALDPSGSLGPEAERALEARFEAAIAAYLVVEVPTCRVCGDPLGELPAVACAGCETPHHRDCWDFNQGCAVFACGGTRTA